MVKYALNTSQLAVLSQRVAWDPEALVAYGIPAEVVRTMVADGTRAVPESPRKAVGERRHRGERTTRYVWGPDIPFLLGYGDRR